MKNITDMKKILLYILPIILLYGCDFIEPRPLTEQTTDQIWSHATYGEGVLTQGYANLDAGYPLWMEYLTDNAIPQTVNENILALGGWMLEGNPIGSWDLCYNTIKYLNMYMENEANLPYRVEDAERDEITRTHRRGEAFFLRAWYQWILLRDYGGKVNGEYLGFPIVTKVLTQDDELDLPRNTYEECVEQIIQDLDSAILLLPAQYDGEDLYTGSQNRGRGSGNGAKALKARVYLNAASPAYSDSSVDKWQRAAKAAAEAIEATGGLRDLKPYGNFNDPLNFDYIWIQPTHTGNYTEVDNYPPSMYGSGITNPTQNLVDAFPAADGYPIDKSEVFDGTNPYKNRDPRFDRFIFFNGDYYNGTYVSTYEGGSDAPGGLRQEGTRTGYFMKKMTSTKVSLDPNNTTTDIKFYVFLHKTELYLNFAEAANEAFGPTDSSLGFSALDVMKKLRSRANPDLEGSDPYLEEQATSADNFKKLILNERRLELAFEGFRFWDMRRLNENLNHTVKGVTIKLTVNPNESGSTSNLARNSKVSTDYVASWNSLDAVNNGYEPTSSWDGVPQYGNWNSSGIWRYVQYDLPAYLVGSVSSEYIVDKSEIYWSTDGGGIQIPDSVSIEIMENGNWKEVWHNWNGESADQWNVASFTPVRTNSVRINFKSNEESCGILQWKVWGKQSRVATFDYKYVDVEEHTFKDYMRYVPLPYRETLIMSNLKQNDGWK